VAYKDFREFLAKLEALGDLKHVTAPVDWDEELGVVAFEGLVRRSPALIFEKIKDHETTRGKRLAVNFIESAARGKVALGLAPNTPQDEVVRTVRQRLRRPLKPVLVSGGACKEIIVKGGDVDLRQFPTPKIHPRDGGRYVMTWSNVITRDPESGWTNVGTYRGMIHDRNTIGMLIEVHHHGAVHMRRWRDLGHRRMPIAVAIGVDPLCLVCSAVNFPSGVDEYDMVGALREAPLELTRCETIDLAVPADAEIVLEGELTVDPEDFRPEGPFGEATGHYVTLKDERRPVFHVNCITHRRDPIHTTRYVGATSTSLTTESNAAIGPIRAAVTWNQMEDRGVEGIKGLRSFGGGGTTVTVISIKQSYYGQAKRVAATLWGLGGGGKITIVVDDDVDISDLNKIMIAIANRVRPAEDVQILRGFSGGELDPSNHPDVLARTGGVGNTDKVLIDATWPMDWDPRPEWGGLRHPPSCLPEEAARAQVKKRWKELGID